MFHELFEPFEVFERAVDFASFLVVFSAVSLQVCGELVDKNLVDKGNVVVVGFMRDSDEVEQVGKCNFVSSVSGG